MKDTLHDLIERAATGQRQSMDELVRTVQPRVRAYLLRSTLDEHLTEDLLQETVLQMATSLKTLKNIQTFWPWLYRIASSKIASHFRKAGRQSFIQFSAFEDHVLDAMLEDRSGDSTEKSLFQELRSVVFRSIESLNSSQRAILSLRCFEDMSYSQIAEAVGCSEANARVQFLRARKKLQSSLKKQGVTRKLVLPALVIFGKLTAGQEAMAANITTQSVSLVAGMTTTELTIATIQSCFIKCAAGIVTTAAALLLGHTAWVQLTPSEYPPRDDVQSVHYTVQGIGLVDESNPQIAVRPANRSRKADVDAGPYYCKGAYEQWLNFPEGPDGPVIVRMQRWSIDGKEKQCAWLQDGNANYYYHSGEKQIYITNDPIGMLTLPTDTPELNEFLTSHGQYMEKIKCSHDRKTGLLKKKVDNRVPSVKNYTTEYAYNSLTEADFEPFWPKDASVVDERDAMHFRGWTYFKIEGHIGDMPIQGIGRIPFTYTAWQEHKPWLAIEIGSVFKIVDTPEGACMIDESTGKVTAFSGGAFFTGLGRPWTGIRAYDTLRRDAAMNQIPFEAKRVEEDGTICIQRKMGQNTYRLLYSIDMTKDIIETLEFSTVSSAPVTGLVTFTYAQEPDEFPPDITTPTLPAEYADRPQKKLGYWPMQLLEKCYVSEPVIFAVN